jgi:hypothetical protein
MMAEFTASLLRFLLVAALPWAVALIATRRQTWFTQRWLDTSIRIQTALLFQIFATQIAGAAGVVRYTEAFLPQVF